MNKKTTSKLKQWLNLRFHLEPIQKHIVYHRVAKNPWYYGDGATLLVLIGVLIFTGMFMGMTYSPAPETAYASVLEITHDTFLGRFIRGLHYWSAGMIVVVLLYHLLRHILLGGYLPPREGTWLVGVMLFILVMTTSFIGYTLRWDENSAYALKVALNIFYKIPLLGDDLVYLVQGGESIDRHTLSRLYAVHVLFIPSLLFLFIGYHVYLVLAHGATSPMEIKHAPETAEEQIELHTAEKLHPDTGHPFFPYMVIKSSSFALVVLIWIVILAALKGPPEPSAEANFTEIAFPQEEWWFHWYSALTAYLPPPISELFHWLFPLFVVVFLVALPFVDHGANRGAQRRPLAVTFAIFVLIAVLGLTGLRFKSAWTAWPTVKLPPLPAGVKLTDSAEQGRRLFVQYGCFNCHGVGGHGSLFAPNLSRIKKRYSQQELHQFISNPPKDIAMPSYARLSEEELEKIVAFVLVVQTFPGEY